MENPDPTAEISTAEVWADIRGRLLPLFAQGVLGYICLIIGLALLLIPGFYLAMPLVLVPAIVIFERGAASPGFSLGRGVSLIRGKWWSTFGLLVVGSIGVGLVALVMAGVAGLVLKMVGLDAEAGNGFLIVQLAQNVVSFILSPVTYLLVLFQYFNLVERREGVSLQWKVEQLGQPAPSRVANETADGTLFRPSYGDQSL